MLRIALTGLAAVIALQVAAIGQDKQTVRGKVLKLGDTWVTIKTDDGRTITLNARHGDERIIDQLGQLRVGDRVVAGWFQGDERAILTGIEKLEGEGEGGGGGGGGGDRPKDKQPPPKDNRKEPPPKDGGRDGQEGQGRDLMLRVVEGRVLRISDVEGNLILVVLVEGRRMEFRVPARKIDGKLVLDKDLEAQVRDLRTGYYVGVGYVVDGEVNVLRWVFLIRGGKVDRREEWAKEREANREEWEKADRMEREKQEKEEAQRREQEEKERRRREEEEKREREKREKGDRK